MLDMSPLVKSSRLPAIVPLSTGFLFRISVELSSARHHRTVGRAGILANTATGDLAGWRSPPVLRTWSIALAAMVAGPTAQAADATLSLACKGTATIRAAPPLEYKPHPISTGLLVNFTSRTVRGTARQGPLSLRRSTSDNRMERGDRHLPRFQPISWHEHQWLHGPHDWRCGYGGDFKNRSSRLLAEMHANTRWRRRIIAWTGSSGSSRH